MSLMFYGLMTGGEPGAAAGGTDLTAGSAARSAENTARRLEVLEQRVETLALLALALAEGLKARAGATDGEILDMVNHLDLRDGVADGRLAPAPRKCGACGRAGSSRHRRCLYCGGESLSEIPPGSVESLLR